MRTEETTYGADKSDNPVVANVCCFLQSALPTGRGLNALKSGREIILLILFSSFWRLNTLHYECFKTYIQKFKI